MVKEVIFSIREYGQLLLLPLSHSVTQMAQNKVKRPANEAKIIYTLPYNVSIHDLTPADLSYSHSNAFNDIQEI